MKTNKKINIPANLKPLWDLIQDESKGKHKKAAPKRFRDMCRWLSIIHGTAVKQLPDGAVWLWADAMRYTLETWGYRWAFVDSLVKLYSARVEILGESFHPFDLIAQAEQLDTLMYVAEKNGYDADAVIRDYFRVHWDEVLENHPDNPKNKTEAAA